MSRKWKNVDPKLSKPVLEAIDALGFESMTPVQSAAIPVFLSHKDVLAQACTGSGKTLSFLIPIFEMMLRREEPWGKHEVAGIVVSPTRELAAQIYEVASHFTGQFLKQFRLLSIIGGVSVENKEVGTEFRKKGGNLIIATPGRLEHVLRSVPQFNVKNLEVLVLDEADRLLDMGFQYSLTQILNYLPKQRRTGLFSATQTEEVKELAKAGLRNPVKIDVKVEYKIGTQVTGSQITPESLQNSYVVIDAEWKFSYLVKYLQDHPTHKVIVFFLTCACVEYFSKLLSNMKSAEGLNVFGLHGQMVTKRRNGMYKQFQQASSGVLLCTDVAARGIDIPDVDLIVQYDAPQDPSYFVHRIGRTARMGRRGKAIVFIIPEEDTYVEFLRVKKVPMVEEKVDMETLKDVTQEVKELALSDRDVMEKAQHAFVSYIRAYKEHKCNFIFVLSQLPFAKVAHSFGLLFFPKLPDLKHFKIQYEHYDVDPNSISYKNKSREEQRLKNAAIDARKREKEQEEREERKKQRAKLMSKKEPKRRRKRTHKEFVEEWDDLAKEALLLKKLKKGKISKKDYEKALLGLGGDDDFEFGGGKKEEEDDMSEMEEEEEEKEEKPKSKKGKGGKNGKGRQSNLMDIEEEEEEEEEVKQPASNGGNKKKKKRKKKKKKTQGTVTSTD